MAEHQRFKYDSPEMLKEDIERLGLDIPLSENLEILKKPVRIGDRLIPNALTVHPMEGCDGTPEGKPGELTFRRYERFARGGAGLLWMEACAVVEEGRANPRQIMLNKENKEAFQRLLDHMIKAAQEEFGKDHRPYIVLQLTHSGRYSKPTHIIAVQNPYLDRYMSGDYRIISDDELERLEDAFVEAAELAAEIGFEAVDIKSCHRYLASELLSAFTREGRYGGSFENRTRFLLNIVDKIQARLGQSIDVTTRMNAYDAIPYPYGWGVDKEDFHKPDLEEPMKLLKLLRERGMKLVNISIGNPYYNPHVGRPFDRGPYTPPEHPLESTAKMLNIMRQMQQSVPDIRLIATGFSWLREYAANVAAAGIEQGWFSMAGFGRQAFAYPDFARDIVEKGKMDRKKCCIACTNCSFIMRDGGMAGCVIKDPEVYAPIFKKGREGKPPIKGDRIAEHV